MHRTATVFCGVWAAAGFALFVAGLPSVNSDARAVVLAAGLAGVGAAALAAWMAWRGRARLAGALLVLSIVTPTWGAAALNLVPLLAGLILVATGPKWLDHDDGRGLCCLDGAAGQSCTARSASGLHRP